MSKCLNLTKAGEYAIAAMSRLALSGADAKPLPVPALARAQKIPSSFLSKIVAQCARAGLIRARKGPSGGVTLARPADRISLLDIIEACEGPYRRDVCVFYGERKCTGPECEVYCSLREREESLRAHLGRVTLADMASALRRHPNNGAQAATAAVEELNGYHEQL